MPQAQIERSVFAGQIFNHTTAKGLRPGLAPVSIRRSAPGTVHRNDFPQGTREVFVTEAALARFQSHYGDPMHTRNGVGFRFETERGEDGKLIATDICWDIDCPLCDRKPRIQ